MHEHLIISLCILDLRATHCKSVCVYGQKWAETLWCGNLYWRSSYNATEASYPQVKKSLTTMGRGWYTGTNSTTDMTTVQWHCATDDNKTEGRKLTAEGIWKVCVSFLFVCGCEGRLSPIRFFFFPAFNCDRCFPTSLMKYKSVCVCVWVWCVCVCVVFLWHRK